jgi:type IV pilus assembly protein PilM
MSFEDDFFALDLSDLSLKIIQIKRNGSVDEIRSHSYLDIPKGLVEDGVILDKEKVAELVRLAIKNAGPKKIKTKKVVCSVPESKAFLRIINIPKMEEAEAAEAIKWEIEASIPLSVDQVYYDWQFLDVISGKQNVLTVAVAKEVIDDLVDTARLADLEVYGLEVESVASVRSLVSKKSAKDDISLIVDLGARRTSFIVSQGYVPYFTSSIPFSSEALSDIISKSLGVGIAEANKIKFNQGIEYSLEDNSIFQAVKPLLENLSAEIEKSIDFFYEVSKGSGEVGRIIICGGGASLKGIVPYLTTRLCRKVSVGDPWINLDFGNKLPIIDRESSLRYSTAVGLALKKINLI